MFYTSSLMGCVTGYAAAVTRLPTAEAALRVEHTVDFHGVWDHRNGKFALSTIFSFHDLTDPKAAVVVWNVRLLTVSGWFDGSKRGRRLILNGKMV